MTCNIHFFFKYHTLLCLSTNTILVQRQWNSVKIIIIIIILSFDIALFPYKNAQRCIALHCQRIDIDICSVLKSFDIYNVHAREIQQI